MEDGYFRTALHFRFDEAKQMLLIHAAGVMHVGINLAQVVEVAMAPKSVAGFYLKNACELTDGGRSRNELGILSKATR